MFKKKKECCSPTGFSKVILVLVGVVLFDMIGLDNFIQGYACSWLNKSPIPCPQVYDMPIWDALIAVLLLYIVKLLYSRCQGPCGEK
jgi:hypothetical protein